MGQINDNHSFWHRNITWRHTSSHTLALNHGSVRYVTDHSIKKLTCSDTCWFTKPTRSINVRLVIRPSHSHRRWKHTKSPTLKRNRSSAKCVVCISLYPSKSNMLISIYKSLYIGGDCWMTNFWVIFARVSDVHVVFIVFRERVQSLS